MTVLRTVFETHITLKEICVDEKGVPIFKDLPDVVLEGKIAKERATNTVNRMYKKKKLAITGYKVITKKYEMSLKKFVENATLVAEY